MNKLYIVGMGPGNPDFLVPAAKKIIEESDVLIGGRRNLVPFQALKKENVVINGRLEDVYQYIVEHRERKRITVLVSGDPSFYSISGFLSEKLQQDMEIETIPGISAIQTLSCKMKVSLNDVVFTSVHGRGFEDLNEKLMGNRKVALFTDGKHSPGIVSEWLLRNGYENVKIFIGENLSYEGEKLFCGTPKEVMEQSFRDLTVMLIIKNQKVSKEKKWGYKTYGIPDEAFIRGNVPMTKQEVRSISLSKLCLREESIVYDIGAGTGSITVECGLVIRRGKVYAIEKNGEALELIQKNLEAFGVENAHVINGYAPHALCGLSEPDRVFIGGSGGNMESILETIAHMERDMKVVLNTVTIESTYEAIHYLEKLGFYNIDIVNISASRGKTAGGKHLMQAMNPVYIISADKEAKNVR
ncbi:MAG: precorrin-6y C5,15-methyltransferase (decarboxylating) subunit CbiE [Clostridia bacterium]|nr:precorrin-6y C5,15-methyltransferase (decarboxylating) subunit CbiE [Clostridia bacterium]